MEEKQLTKEEREKLHEQQIQEKIKQDKNKKLIKKISIYSILVIVIAAILYVSISSASKPGKYDDFAKCLTEKDVKEYGAFWCPNCAKQKEMFGKSFQYVTYIECDARGKNPQPSLCKEKNIKGYPTWEYNETFLEGVQSLEELSQWTGCSLSAEN